MDFESADDRAQPAPRETLVELTTRVVTAYVSRHNLDMADVPALLESVYSTMSKVCGRVDDPLTPAVPISKSLKQQELICLECGQALRMLKRHLRSEHNLAPEEYRRRWGLNSTYPKTAPDYASTRSAIAKQSGLGRNMSGEQPRKRRTKRRA